MRRLVSGLLLVLLFTLPAAADQASGAYKQGQRAEQDQKYEQAYENFRQAYQLKPNDVRYRAAFERTRFEASAAAVKRGQELRQQGNLQGALTQFRRAFEIDPGLAVARQEIERTQEMIDNKASGRKPETEDIGERAAHAAGPAELKPISNQPITLRMTEDTKTIYTTIGKLAGINVLFDPDYVSRRITIELNNVSLYEALETVALISRTFWRPVTSNTILVGADTKAKRSELEQSVVKTFYMNNLSQSTELQDVVNTLRTVLEITRVLPLPTQNAIVVRGSPDQVALAEKLINDIDKAKPEVLVEVAIMQVTRDRIRDLGISPPGSATVQLQPNVTTTTSSTTTNSTTGSTSTPGALTLNKLNNLNANDFQVTIPSASLNFLASDSDTRIIQNPQIRIVDGQKASLKIGDRVPVATGSFQPGIGGVGINPLVNTQFQYIDVGVNIDVTPNIHADGEVTLKVKLEVSSVTSHVNIGGIDQPVIGQRTVEHEVRLKEGEVNLMGGIMEQQDVKSLSGWPFISKVPVLRYLFSSEHTEKSENEIVFALIPHIVRGPMITDLNTRALDVGTANGISLRPAGMDGTAQPNGAAAAPNGAQPQATPPTPMQPATPQGQPAPGQPQVQPPETQTPGPGGQPAGNLGAGGAIFSFDPPQIQQPAGSTFAMNVSLSNAQDVHSVPLTVNYDPKVLELVNISNGGFLGKDGQPVALVHREEDGTLQITASRPPGATGISGSGPVFTLTFMAKSSGQTTVSITRAAARNSNMQPIPATGSQALVTVK